MRIKIRAYEKNDSWLLSHLLLFVFFAALLLNPVSATQPTQKTGDIQNPIPADVMKFLGKSCMGCHSDQGGKMEMSVLNLSGWEKYAPKKTGI